LINTVLQPKHITAALVFAAFGTAAFAQNTLDNSAYSRFGLGDLIGNETVQTAAQGGTSTAWTSTYSLNSTNPAALGSLNLTEYSLGLYGKYARLSTATAFTESYSGNINHLSLAIPIFNPINEIGVKKKRDWKWGVAVGLRPYSQVGYAIETINEEIGLGKVIRQYKGSGGTYQLNIDNGFKWKNISGGIALQYLFGKEIYQRNVIFNDSVSLFTNPYAPSANIFVDNIAYSGLGAKLGAQYEYIISKQGSENAEDFRRRDKLRAVLGATYAPSFEMQAINSFIRTRSVPVITTAGLTSTQELVLDSTRIGSATMPGSYSVGLRFIKDNHWQAAVQYDAKSWSAYKNTERPEVLANTYALRVGGEWTPNYKSFTSYGSRMSYRAGFYTASDPRIIFSKNVQYRLETNAVTMGVGMPIRLPRGMMSHCNMNLEIGEQGSYKLIKEFYTKFTIGFTLNDHLWFARPKYN
jgi:hypothetical protein